MAIVKSVRAPEGSLTGWSRAVWFIALFGLTVAIGVVITARAGRGLEIQVGFRDGHGIKLGDAVRHRGIDVGEVTGVALNPDLNGVNVQIVLFPHATGIAREGARFWIQRPRLSLNSISGLDTVLGAKYVAVWPGPASSAPAQQFVGLEAPLTLSGDDELHVDVRFAEGHGITLGSPVRHRGVEIGEVVSFDFEPGLRGLHVGIRLVRGARQFARSGSQFWIERPNLSLAGIRGLETILGGPYVSALPGKESSEVLVQFDGLDVPPIRPSDAAAGIEFVLLSPERKSLERGAPVTYRGLQIGQVLTVGLSADARQVEARLHVSAPYVELLRENTKFWSYGGMDFSLGLTGINLNLDNLASVAAGGIALATPEPPGASVHTGHRFALLDEPPSNWRDWSPRIAVSSPLLQTSAPLPALQRASLVWRARRLGIARTHRRQGWILPLANGNWLIPSQLFKVSDEMIDDSIQLEVAGIQIPMDAAVVGDQPVVATAIPQELMSEVLLWPMAAVRASTVMEELVLFTGPQDPQLVVTIDQMRAIEDGWSIDASVPLDNSWTGAAAVSRHDARLIGILVAEEGHAWIVPLTALLKTEQAADPKETSQRDGDAADTPSIAR